MAAAASVDEEEEEEELDEAGDICQIVLRLSTREWQRRRRRRRQLFGNCPETVWQLSGNCLAALGLSLAQNFSH